MKQLFLQKESASDLFLTVDTGCKFTDDLADFLIKDFSGYHLVCDFQSAEEYEIAAAKNPILEAILDKINNITYNPNLGENLQDDKFYDGLLGDRNLFITQLDENKCNELTLKRGYMFISSPFIASTWSPISRFRKPTHFKVTKDKSIDEAQRFDNWTKLISISHPIKSMVIFDKYLFKNVSPSEISLNLIPLIDNLLYKNDRSRKIKVTLISEIKTGFTLKQYIEKISQLLKEINRPNIVINIIRHIRACYPSDLKEGLHTRLILTNYLHVISDASFNYFKKNGAVENVTNITASFNLQSFHDRSFTKDINDLKLYISKLKNENSSDLNYQDKYFPDKINSLLN